MFDRLDIRDGAREAARKPAAPVRQATPGRDRERPGHRRDYDPRRERIGMAARQAAAMADLGQYRVAAVVDISREHFGGNPFAARRAIDALKKQGLVEEHPARGPKGEPYKVLTATEAGARAAGRHSRQRGLDAEQRTWAGLVKPKEIGHDVAIYRAGREVQRNLEERGATLRRVRIDVELKAEIARRTETARARDGKAAADRERLQAAEELHLPVEDGKVMYPDAQLEFTEEDGVTRGHANLEVVSEHYRGGDIAAKAAAGFQMHGNGSARAQALISAVRAAGGGGGGGGGGPRPGEGLMEL